MEKMNRVGELLLIVAMVFVSVFMIDVFPEILKNPKVLLYALVVSVLLLGTLFLLLYIFMYNNYVGTGLICLMLFGLGVVKHGSEGFWVWLIGSVFLFVVSAVVIWKAKRG